MESVEVKPGAIVSTEKILEFLNDKIFSICNCYLKVSYDKYSVVCSLSIRNERHDFPDKAYFSRGATYEKAMNNLYEIIKTEEF